MDFFRELDVEGKGFLTSENLMQYFTQDEDFALFNFSNLVKYWNCHDEDKLTFVDL